MVSVTHAISQDTGKLPLDLLMKGLGADCREKISRAAEYAVSVYKEQLLGTGEPIWDHALGMALIVSSLRLDVDARLAALLFAVTRYDGRTANEKVSGGFGEDVATLVTGLDKLNGVRVATRFTSRATAVEIHSQTECLRKMLMTLVQDIRVVLLRLASRTQTLRFIAASGEQQQETTGIARESLDIYASLANRLGVWQLKWELEDLSFRFLDPESYKRIARMLDERRVEREAFIAQTIKKLKAALAKAAIKAEVYGRPKHIYSIYNKMQAKKLDFSQLYDIRALRVLVDEVADCYKTLDVVNSLWKPIAQEYDDYISRPKGNNYQSLHTAVWVEDGRALEVQIRTHEMHRHAELGVAAHWRYKEGSNRGSYDGKIVLLRSLLQWKDEVTDSAHWAEQLKQASLNDTIYVVTPQGRVIDLPQGATAIDFAYRLHTEVGHHCRGAKVNGQLIPLNRPLESGQTVEVITAKEGGPSLDWLALNTAYVATHRARVKIRQYFNQQEEEALLARGRNTVTKEMQREGQTQANTDTLANKLGFRDASAMFLAAGRGELGSGVVQRALRGKDDADGENGTAKEVPEVAVGRSRSRDPSNTVLIDGVGKLMTALSRCCKPAPPDAIKGFITKGRGVSVHRVDCHDFQHMAHEHPERVVSADWGDGAVETLSVFPVEIEVEATDRQGLLRDISEVLSRDKFNVTAVNTLSKKGHAFMRFTLEVNSVDMLQIVIRRISQVPDVIVVKRR